MLFCDLEIELFCEKYNYASVCVWLDYLKVYINDYLSVTLNHLSYSVEDYTIQTERTYLLMKQRITVRFYLFDL